MRGGVSEVLGLDYGQADDSQMYISRACFERKDLSKPIELKKKYDLSMSLEVAEHIDEKCADIFVGNLCRCSDIVLFSAAIKGQGGTGHINEQPASYWVEKFKKQGYFFLDIVRPKFWDDNDIEVWYRQNTLLFYKKTMDMSAMKFNRIKNEYYLPIDIAHPQLVEGIRNVWDESKRHYFNFECLKVKHPSIYNMMRSVKHTFVRK